MLNFKQLRMKNFLSVGNQFVDIDLGANTSTLIRGTNGAGKTTMLDALDYALFNKSFRKVKLGQLVNSVNKKACVVEVEFNTLGRDWLIRRGQKPSVFEIYENGKAWNQDASANDLQKKLEVEVLRTDFKTFNQVVVVGSMGHTKFMELSAGDRRGVVETMLDIEVVSSMADIMKKRLSTAKAELNEVTTEISKIGVKIQSAERSIQVTSDNNDEQLSIIDERLAELDVEQKGVTDAIECHKAKEPAPLDVSIKQKLDKLNGQHREGISKMGVLKSDAMRERQSASFYMNNEKCDRCGQDIDDDFKSGIISDCNDRIERAGKLHNECSAIVDRIKLEIDELQLAVNKHQSEYNEWSSGARNLTNDLNRINNEISNQNRAKQRLLSHQSNNNAKLYQEIEELQAEQTKQMEIRAERNETVELLTLGSTMLTDKGLKAKIIRQYLPIINGLINEYLDAMGAHYSFVLDEQFNETIKSRYRDNFSYGSFSNGESQRINMAILFMWRKLAETKNTVSSNILLLDEVLDGSLDKEGIDYLMDLFEAQGQTNIMVVSHRTDIVDNFDRIIDVNKVGNFSEYTITE